jgi:hypothetical protein
MSYYRRIIDYRTRAAKKKESEDEDEQNEDDEDDEAGHPRFGVEYGPSKSSKRAKSSGK